MADNPYLVLSPEEMARQEASNYLASQGVPGYSSAAGPPAPAMSVAPAAPPPDLPPAGPPPHPIPAAPEKPSIVGEALKRGAISAGATMLGGPVGGMIANSAMATRDVQPQARTSGAATTAEGGDSFGPPPPPLPTEADPVMLSRPGMGQARMVSPAGMYPHAMQAQAHMGRPVPEEARAALAASTGLQLEGAEKQHGAETAYQAAVYNIQSQRMAADDAARVNHARVQADRDAMVRRRLAEIEATNEEASGAIDPSKYWHDRGAFASIIGALAVAAGEYAKGINGGSNTAKAIIDAGVNREIDAQMKNRQVAGQKVARQERLLDLHLNRLGDEDKSIEATRLGLYDNVARQLDSEAAKRGIDLADANYLNLKGDIFAKRADILNRLGLQEADDITRSYSEQWRPAQFAGGSAGQAKFEDPKHIITVPASDGTGEQNIHVAVNESVYKDLSAQQGQTNTLVQLNHDALKTRAELRDASSKLLRDPTNGDLLQKVTTLRTRLQGYNNDRASMAEKAKDPNSAVRDPEFNRQVATGVDYTAGILGHDSRFSGDTDKAIQANSNEAQRLTDARLRGATGQVVRHGQARSKEGYIVNQWLPTGELYAGKPVAPEKK